ncbi:MAG: J domain-containing protein [Geobacteraceae bacterium]|nr:J domain-containing protein [Geobacteraceae bacterium]
MTYEELTRSLAILGLPERVTLGEIKQRYRCLVKESHPDTGKDADPDSFRKIHAAYRILMKYADAYKINCSEEEFYEQNPEERLRKQFLDDPIWGGQ